MLQREESKLIVDIKKQAKLNNTQSMKTLAKSLVRLRGQMNQLRASEAQLRGVKTTITVPLSPRYLLICTSHELVIDSNPCVAEPSASSLTFLIASSCKEDQPLLRSSIH
jgi:hypothetical protein